MSQGIANMDTTSASPLSKRLKVWLCPFAGGLATAAFITLKNIPYPPCGYFACSALFAFGVYFVRDTILGYIIALPLLALARHAGVKKVSIFMLIAVIAALPMALVPGIYAFASSATGLLFGLGSKQSKLSA